jgi:hypothetical protein
VINCKIESERLQQEVLKKRKFIDLLRELPLTDLFVGLTDQVQDFNHVRFLSWMLFHLKTTSTAYFSWLLNTVQSRNRQIENNLCRQKECRRSCDISMEQRKGVK